MSLSLLVGVAPMLERVCKLEGVTWNTGIWDLEFMRRFSHLSRMFCRDSVYFLFTQDLDYALIPRDQLADKFSEISCGLSSLQR